MSEHLGALTIHRALKNTEVDQLRKNYKYFRCFYFFMTEDDIFEILRSHDKWRLEECINLIPSENVMSRKAREILTSDFGHRYTLRRRECPDFSIPFENFYCGTKYIDRIQGLSEELACKIFSSKYAFTQPVSGHIAAMAMIVSLCKRGDGILCLGQDDGGYPGYWPNFMPSYFGLKSDFLPFDLERFDLDYDLCEKKILNYKPRLVVLGGSFILFPCNIGRIREACNKVDAFIGYDASHVLGLIGGGEFQKPLEEGADIMIGSTHKSLFGPQGGLILTNSEIIAQDIMKNLRLKIVDNTHSNRVAALGYTLLEMQRFGRAYAKQVVRNAQALGKYLSQNEIPVRYGKLGYTKSHQILLDIKKIEKEKNTNYSKIAEKSEATNIIIDRDGRMGTQEMTRWGMNEKDMAAIASLFSRIYKNENIKKVNKDVIKVRRRFRKINYCIV